MPYIGRDLNRGNYLKLDDISSSFNSSTKTFNLTVGGSAFTPGSAFSILVSVGGVIQEPESAYQVNNSEITFANAPTAQDGFFCLALAAPIGIGVPGNGTVNGPQIAKPFNYDGFFYLNDASNRVGINSSIPTASLDVIGDIKLNGSLLNSGGGGLQGNVYAASGISTFYDVRVTNNLTVEGTTTTLDTNLIGVDRIEVGANSSSIVGVAITQSGTADILNLYDGSTEVFSVADGGNVTSTGDLIISSTLPRITLNDTNHESDFDIKNENGSFRIRDLDNPTDRYRINSSGGTIHEFFGVADFNSHLTVNGTVNILDNIVHIGDPNTKFGFPAGDTITFETAGAERLRIKSTGQILYSSSSGDNQITSKRTNAANGNGNYFFHLSATNNSDTEVGALGFHRDTATDDSRFILKTRNTGGSSQERLRITSGGNLGVGDYSSTSLTHAIQALRTSGTTVVSAKNTNGNATLYAEASNGNTARLEVFQAGTSGYSLRTGSTDALQFYRDSSFLAQFDSSGRLLIGGSSNSASSHADELQIINTSAQGGLSIINASNGQGNIYFGHSGGTADGRIEYSHQADYMRFFTANDERLRIDSSGRVGIGTNTMDSSAEVSITNASSSARVYMKSADNADCSIYFGSMNDAATGAIRYDHSDDTLRFYGYNNSERLQIQSTGIVKVETSDSSSFNAHFLVNNSESNSGISLIGSGSSFSAGGWAAVTDAGIIRSSANSSNGLVLQAASGDMRFYVAGNPPAERLRIESVNSTRARFNFGALNGDFTNPDIGGGTAGVSINKNTIGQIYACTDNANNTAANDYQTVVLNVSRRNTSGDGPHIALDRSGWIKASLAGLQGSNTATSGPGSFAIYTHDYSSGQNVRTERLRIDSSGRLLLGHNATDDRDGFNSALQVTGTGGDDSSITLGRWSSNQSPPNLVFSKSRNGTIGSHTTLDGGDYLGQIQFLGDDGSNYHVGASIQARVENFSGGVGSDDMPTRLFFNTNRDEANVTNRMIIHGRGSDYGVKYGGRVDILGYEGQNITGGSRTNVLNEQFLVCPSAADGYADSHTITFGQTKGNWESGTSSAYDTSYGLMWFYGGQYNSTRELRAGIHYDHKGQERFKFWSSYGDIIFKTRSTSQGDYTAEECDQEPLRITDTNRVGINRGGTQSIDYTLDVDGQSIFRNWIRFGSGGTIKSTAYSGNSTPTYDTGISVNAYGYGGGMVILCHQNYNAGTGTRAGVYHLWFYYDGNHQPPVTHMGGSNFVTFGKSASNTLTISMGAGNNMFSYFGSGLNI